MTLAELLALIANLAAMSDEELADLEANLEAAAEERADAATDEALDELVQIRDAVRAVRTEASERAEASAERRAQAQAALEEIRAEDGDGPEDEENADDAGDGEEGGESDAGDGNEDAAGDGEEDGGATSEDQQEQLAAGAAPRPPRIARVAARRPAAVSPRTPAPMASLPALGLTASANLPGFTAGERIDDVGKLADAFWSAVQSTAGYRHGPRVKVPIVRAGSERPQDLGWPEERILDGNVRGNMRKINDVTAPRSIVAAGGICAPSPVQYDLPILQGTDDRPVRDDMLVRFGADRGGVVTLPPPVLTDLDGAITVWTSTNDENPTDPTTKPCLEVTCPAEDETIVDAIVNCLQYGNFRSRFFGEQIEAWMRLAAVNHARVSEVRSLTTIGTGSTQVTHGQLLGTIPDIIGGLRLASAAIRNRHRLGQSFPLRFGAPFWLYDQMAVDEARRLPGGGTLDEQYALGQASVNRWLAAMNLNVTWFEDGETGQIFGPQGDGPLVGWPSTVVTYLYPEGSWLFLDGGTLDLGIVRDSVLNSTNDVQVFSETFEATHFHGVESYRLTFDTCPDGSVSSTVDIDPCSTGS